MLADESIYIKESDKCSVSCLQRESKIMKQIYLIIIMNSLQRVAHHRTNTLDSRNLFYLLPQCTNGVHAMCTF